MADPEALRAALRAAVAGRADEAVTRRREALDLPPRARPTVDRVDVPARLRALAALERLRQRSELTPALVEGALGPLDLRGAPDLQRAAERLRVAAAAGPALAALARDPAVDPGLCRRLDHVLRAAPDRASALRAERVAAGAGGGFEPARTAHTLARLREAVPDAARLEAPWLEALANPAAPPERLDRTRLAVIVLFLGWKVWTWGEQLAAAVSG